MCTDDTTEFSAQEPSEPTDASPEPVAETAPRPGWSRRTFLKAAALGTAAAALLHQGEGGGLGLGVQGAGAAASGTCPDGVTPDLSFLSCTANDVTINGPGIVQNEPCGCGTSTNNTFPAVVAFPVTNHTGTGRYCIQISIGNGLGVPCQDVILTNPATGNSTVPANSTVTMVGTVLGFPCNSGGTLVCLGAANTPASGACPSECVTVGWSTSSGSAGCTSPTKVPGGQCRHQQLCIQGFGAGLSCTAGCTPTCGGQSTLTATVGAAPVTSGTPFTYTLNAVDCATGTVLSQVATFGPTAATSHDFVVTAPQGTTCYAVTVCDSRLGTNCCRTSSAVTLNVAGLPSPGLSASAPDCSGSTTFTASPTGLADYTFTIDGTSTDNGTNNKFTTTLAPGDHTATVTVKNSAGCAATSPPVPVHVNQPVSASAAAGTPDCAGKVTLTASASGGAGGYTFAWFDGKSSLGTGSPLTVTLAPGDHSITVTATDSAGCSGTSAPITVHINQPVSASAAAGSPDCAGNTTLTASASGGAGGFTYTWFDGSTQIGTGNPLAIKLAPGDHSVTVTVTDSAGCAATSSPVPVHVNQPVSTSLDTGSAPDCTGHTTFTASATGGTGTYTFAWTIDGSPVAGNSTNQLAYPPNVDCNPHTISVTATDSNGCVSGNTASRTITQVVATTVK